MERCTFILPLFLGQNDHDLACQISLALLRLQFWEIGVATKAHDQQAARTKDASEFNQPTALAVDGQVSENGERIDQP